LTQPFKVVIYHIAIEQFSMIIKIVKIVFVVSFAAGLAAFFSSCQNDDDYEYYMIEVDSVYITEPVIANQIFDLEFFGYVGHNGCYSFSKFVLERQSNIIIVEVHGKLNVKSGVCSDVMVGLNGEKLSYKIEQKGNYTLRIKQPDGTFLELPVLVE
jgi:hypothetical protein